MHITIDHNTINIEHQQRIDQAAQHRLSRAVRQQAKLERKAQRNSLAGRFWRPTPRVLRNTSGPGTATRRRLAL